MERRSSLAGRIVYPAILLALTLVFFARPLARGQISVPLDTLGFMYPWNTQARATFAAAYPGPQQNPLLEDQLTVFTPFYLFARQQTRQMRLPLWTPSEMGGAPFLANNQSAVLYPVNLVSYLLPAAMGLQFQRMVRPLGAGLGMYFFLLALGTRRQVACLGAVAFMFSSFIVVWLGWSLPAVATWLPWSFLAAEKLLQGDRRRLTWMAVLAIVTALHLLAGHVETSAHIFLALSIYLSWYCVTRVWTLGMSRVSLIADRRAILAAIGGVTLGIAIAAMQLLPTATYLLDSYTYEVRSGGGRQPPQQMANIGLWLVPNLAGNPAYGRLDLFAAQWTFDRGLNYNERTGYVGIATLLCAALALVYANERLRWQRNAFVILLVMAGCVVYGVEPVFWISNTLPVIGTINHYRALLVMCFALAALAAIGLDGLLDRLGPFEPWRWSHRRDKKVVAGAVCLAATGVFAVGAALHSKAQIIHLMKLGARDLSPVDVALWTRSWTAFALLLLAGGVLLLTLLVARRIEPRLGVAALTCLLIGDLFVFGAAYNPRVSPRYLFPPTPLTDTMRGLGPEARFAMGQGDPGRIAPALIPNLPKAYGLRDLTAYDGIVGKRPYHFMDAVNRHGPNRNFANRTLPNITPDRHLLAVANVTHVLLPTTEVEPPNTGLRLVYERDRNVDQPFVCPTDNMSAVAVSLSSKRQRDQPPLVARIADVTNGVDVAAGQAATAHSGDDGWAMVTFPAVAASRGHTYRITLHDAGLPAGATAGATALRLRVYASAERDGLSPVWHDERYTLYAVNGARPRAYVANGVVPVSDAASALAALDRLHVPGSDAVVETVNALTSTGGTARITTDRPGEITVRVSAASQGLVVLNEAYGDGGWRATVDGATQPILRANYLYQGVVIPAGDHTVRFTYRPTAFVAGAAVSAGSMIGVLVLVFVDLVGRRRMKAGR